MTKSDKLYYCILVILLVTFIIIRFNIIKIEVPSGSMMPTLEVNDVILCQKVHDPSNLKRGDIVIFYNEELDLLLVKRLIGLPGEIIDIRDGIVYADGIPINEPYVYFFDSFTDGTFSVPSDFYFFLGDNRKNSNDARFWEDAYIPANNIKAKAVFRISPSGRIGFVK